MMEFQRCSLCAATKQIRICADGLIRCYGCRPTDAADAQPPWTGEDLAPVRDQGPASACEVCGRAASATWYDLLICAACVAAAEARAATGACVCLDCLQHQHPHSTGTAFGDFEDAIAVPIDAEEIREHTHDDARYEARQLHAEALRAEEAGYAAEEAAYEWQRDQQS
jgi:hypothetical protein